MTVGSVSRGSNTSSFWFTKQWSGLNDPVNHRSFNPYTANGRQQTRDIPLMTFYDGSVVQSPWPSIFNADNLSYSLAKATWTNNDELELLSRLSLQIRGTDLQLGSSLAELPQAVRGVASTCKNILSAYRAVRHGNLSDAVRLLATSLSGDESLRSRSARYIKFKATLPSRLEFEKRSAARFKQAASRPDGFAIMPPRGASKVPTRGRLDAKSVSDAWLSLQYGWKPLLSDIYDTMEWYEGKTRNPRVLKFHASKVKKSQVANVNSGTTSTKELFVPASLRASSRITYLLTEQLSTPRALGLTNPASVAWEVVPFSFVVDWFIPIGNYLELTSLFSSLSGSYQRSNFYTADAARRISGFVSGKPPNGWFISAGYVSSRAWAVERASGTSLSVPRPEFKAVERAFSLGHIENAAALVVSAIKRARS